MAKTTLNAYVNNETGMIRIHAAGCTHALREARLYGLPIVVRTETQLGLIRALRAEDIRSDDFYFLGCIGVSEAYAILAPNGEAVSVAASRKAATRASARIRREARKEIEQAIANLSPFAQQMLTAQN
jgi:hypothetical protein